MNASFEMANGEVRLWIEQETLHIKVVDPHGDPVELTNEEAAKLAKALMEFSKKVDK